MESGVFILFFSEKQPRFANGLQNLFDMRSFSGGFCRRFWGGRAVRVFAGAKGADRCGRDFGGLLFAGICMFVLRERTVRISVDFIQICSAHPFVSER